MYVLQKTDMCHPIHLTIPASFASKIINKNLPEGFSFLLYLEKK